MCLAPGSPYEPVTTPDAAGGVVVAWSDLRDGTNAGHVFAARVLEDGTVDANWPVDGRRVSTHGAPQRLPSILPALDGGTFVLLHAVGAASTELRLQRLTATGAIAPGWPEEGRVIGLPVTLDSAFGSMVADSTGAFIVAHVDDDPPTRTIRLFRFTPEGDPDPAWPLEGVLALQVSPEADEVFNIGLHAFLDSDRQGGVWLLSRISVYWDTKNEGGERTRWHLVRITAQGTLPAGWPGSGPLLADEGGGSYYAYRSGVAVAGGSFFFCYPESAGLETYTLGRIYDPDGSSRELGRIAESEPTHRRFQMMYADGLGGAFIESQFIEPQTTRLWRIGFEESDPVVRWIAPYLPQFNFYVLGLAFPDGEGGIYSVRPGGPLRMTRLLGGSGAWDPPSSFPAGKVVTALDPNAGHWCGTRTPAGGLALFWAGNRRGEYDLYYTGSATPMSALASPVRVAAEADRTEIEWWFGSPVGQDLTLERQTGVVGWEECGLVEWRGVDRVLSVDPDPPPGSVDYRLRGAGPDGSILSEVVSVPGRIPDGGVSLVAASPQRAGLEFRLEGFPGRDYAVSCLDVSGREVARVRVGAASAAQTRLALAPGLYFLHVGGQPGTPPRKVVVLP